MKKTKDIQLGSLLLGLAMTIPGLAPAVNAPSGPMLFSRPCKAIGVSLDRNESSDPVARGTKSTAGTASAVGARQRTPSALARICAMMLSWPPKKPEQKKCSRIDHACYKTL